MRRLVLLFVLLLPGLAAAQALEYEVKAAYLYRFLAFIEWPKSAFARPDSPLVIGVIGADDVLSELRHILPGRVVQGRPLAVQRLREGEKLSGLHVLYIGRNASGQLSRLDAMRGLLVVSDAESGLERGAVVNFVRSEGRVRFEVALDAAERRELKISSRMLAVASHVRPGKL